MKLRDYQLEALEAIKANHLNGINRQLVVLPTSSGKSVCFSNIPLTIGLASGQQAWLLVHRNELVEQAAKHFRRDNPDLKVGIERAKSFADLDCDIIVASVQSIGTTNEGFTKRIQRFDPTKVSIVIGDELHHFISGINMNILKYLGVLKGDDRADNSKLLVGFTATPSGRSDGVGLEAIVDRIVYSKDMREMIDLGWLAPIQAFRVETQVDLSGIRVTRGDFAPKELERRVNTPERNGLVVAEYQKRGDGKPAIAFTVDVRHSHDLASEFRRAGISALPLSGQTPEDERARLLSSFKSGETRVIASCSVLGEGVDLPWAEVGLMCRPTKSTLLFTQNVGRLSRPHPAPEEVSSGARKIKERALIIDFVDNSLKHRICSVPTLFGLRPDFDLKGESVTEALEVIEKAQEKHKQLRLDTFRDLKSMETIIQTIDLMRPPKTPDAIRAISNLMWIEGAGGSYQILSKVYHFSVRENQLGQFEIAEHKAGVRRIIGFAQTLQDAILSTESRFSQDDLRLLKANSKWHQDGPSDKQINLLLRLKPDMYKKFGRDRNLFSQFIKDTYTKGDVSAMISACLSSMPPPRSAITR